MAWVVEVAGVDRTSYIQPFTGLSIENRAYEGSGTCTLPVRISDGSWTPAAENTVRVTRNGVEMFEGIVRTVEQTDPGWSTGTKLYTLNCQDYTTLLDDDVIDTAFRSVSESDAARVTWLINTFGTRGVTAGAEVQTVLASMPAGDDGRPEQDFSGKSLREAMDQVAKISGASFYVDYDKKAHWFATESNSAPFGLSDTPNGTTTFGYTDLQIDDDSIDLIHELLVVGGPNMEVKQWVSLTTPPSPPNRRRGVLRDTSITSTAQATAAGQAYLASVATPKRSGTLTTTHDGLRAGQIVQITHQGQGLSGASFRINSVVAKPNGAVANYEVSFGEDRPDLAAMVGGTSRRVEEVASSVGTVVQKQVTSLQSGGANLVKNSDFESGTGNSWTVGSLWVVGVQETGVSGTRIARADVLGTDAGSLTMLNRVPVDRLQDYWLSWWSYITGRTAGSADVVLTEYDGGGTLLATTTIGTVTANETAWTRHAIHYGPNDQVGRVAFQPTTASINIAFKTSGSATLVYRVDAVQIEQGVLMTSYAPAPYELMDGQIVGPEIADSAIGETQISDDAITTPKLSAGAVDTNKLAANAVVAGKIAAGAVTAAHISAEGLSADQITSGTLTLGGLPGNPDVLVVYDSTGQEIGRWDENGLIITDVDNALLKLRLEDGVLQFSEDGGTTWTTAISGQGISADSITLGTFPGGSNAVPNSGFEMSQFSSSLQRVWTSSADWTATIGTDVNVTKTGTSLTMTTATF